MRSSGGIRMNWPVVAIAFAVIGLPMGIALIQDLGSDSDEEELLARIGEVDEIAPVDDDTDEETDDETTGQWEQPAMEQAFFDEVFLGGPEESKPALRGPLAAVRWDEPARDEVVASIAARWPRADFELYPSISFDGRTDAVVVSFPDDGTAERVLTSRWGEPLRVTGTEGRARQIWSSPTQRLKLVLAQEDGEAVATFAHSIPAAELISENGRFEFETFPILGATSKQLAARYGSAYDVDSSNGTVRVECPGVEVSYDPAECRIELAGDKAVRITMVVDHRLDPDGGPHLFAALRSRLGEPRTHSSEWNVNTWTFDRRYTVTQVVGSPELTIERTAR